MFIGPPKLVFIKTAEGTTQAAIRPGNPMASNNSIAAKSHTILMTPNTVNSDTSSVFSVATSTSSMPVSPTMAVDDAHDETPPPRYLLCGLLILGGGGEGDKIYTDVP